MSEIPGAIRLLARAVAATHRRVQPSSRLPWDAAQRRAERLRIDFHMLIQSGVFETQGIPCETRILSREVTVAMQKLESEDPDRYRATPPETLPRSERKLDTNDVERLYEACRTHRETAVLALLAESAFRANAIEGARLHDVWDVHRCEIHAVICLIRLYHHSQTNVIINQ